jgi:hypothetical protein
VRRKIQHTELDVSIAREEDVGSLDVSVDLSLCMKILESQEKFPQNNRNMILTEWPRLEQVQTRSSSQVLHN